MNLALDNIRDSKFVQKLILEISDASHATDFPLAVIYDVADGSTVLGASTGHRLTSTNTTARL